MAYCGIDAGILADADARFLDGLFLRLKRVLTNWLTGEAAPIILGWIMLVLSHFSRSGSQRRQRACGHNLSHLA